MENQTRHFIEAWGAIGTKLGVSPNTARIHALLMASDEALAMEEVCQRLEISIGSASMGLRELRDWGVVRAVQRQGERSAYWESEPDIWRMAVSIARERKRREFDPILDVLRRHLPADQKQGAAAQRLAALLAMVNGADRLLDMLLEDEDGLRRMIAGFGIEIATGEEDDDG